MMDISPDLIVNTYDGVEVVEENHLPVGTKQRGILQYVRYLIRENPLVRTIVYTGGFNGYGPVVAAFAARECNLDCHLLLTTSRVGQGGSLTRDQLQKETTVKKARHYGANITFVHGWKKMVAEGKRITSDPTTFWLPLGIEHKVFTQSLSRAIARAGKSHSFKHIVVAGGVGEVAKAIRLAFPDCKVTAVAVSSVDKLKGKLKGTDIEVVPPMPAEKGTPPVPTVVGYDSHAYFVAKDLGATWWNVAGDNTETDIIVPPAPTPIKCEEMRAAVHRQMMYNFYVHLRGKVPAKFHANLARLVPDMFARLLFRSYVGQKTGDPIVLNKRDWDKTALQTQLKYRFPDFHFDLPNIDDITPRCPSNICCATFEDVPPHLVQLLRDKYQGTTFEVTAVLIYLRYATLGAIGHQMAMPLNVKKYLVDTFVGGDPCNVTELFASAFNAGLPKFMSLFPDIEEPMGSVGTFGPGFTRAGTKIYIANPPYDEKMLAKMVDLFLAEAAQSEDFTVLFGMPEWDNFPPLDKLRASPLKKIEVVFKNREVAWMNLMHEEPNRTANIPAHSWFVVSTKEWSASIGEEMARIWRRSSYQRG